MKNFFNLIIKTAIIWITATLFPERVTCDSGQALALAIAVFMLITIATGLVSLVLTLLSAKSDNLVFAVIAIIIQVLSGFLELLIANLFVPGFAINGIGTYVVLALVFSYCSVEINLNKN